MSGRCYFPFQAAGFSPTQIGRPHLKTVGVVAVRLKNMRQGSLGRAADFCEVDVKQLAVPLAEATCDHDRIDLSALG
jgi:hypothetical protein